MNGLINSYHRVVQWGEDLSPAKNALLGGLMALIVSLGLSFVFGGSLMYVVLISVGVALGVFSAKIADARG